MFRLFENLVDPFAPYPPEDAPPRRLWPFLKGYMRPFRAVFWATGLFAAAVAAIELWLIHYSGRLIDTLTATDPARVWAEHGTELLLVAFFVLILRPLIFGIQALLLNNAILPNFGTLIRWRAHAQVLRQSVGWFENDFAGRIANRVMQTPPSAGDAVYQAFDAIAYAISYIAGAALLLWTADPRLMLPLLLWVLPYACLVTWVVRRIGPASAASSAARSRVNGRIVDAYTNIHAVKLFAQGNRELEHARDAIAETRATFQREMRLFTIMDIALTLMNGLLIVGVVGWAIWLWTEGLASVGVVAAASALVLRLSNMSGWIMMAVSDFFRSLGVVRRGWRPSPSRSSFSMRPMRAPSRVQEGRIEIRGLVHRYRRRTGGLGPLDLTIEPGQKVGLVGRSGAGKSTLVKLILRFHEAEAGTILIDGQDIRSVTQDSLRAAIGMVGQEASLLHRSVRENILYGRPEASEEAMIRAARQAEAHDFILGLEDSEGNRGYDARVGERGVKLSGGQRQRIALARVILKDAPILILDEATSALDSEAEAAIQSTLGTMMEGKTVIAIAHRLSTIARMDRIVVLDQGRILEDGPHEALIRQGGLYARLWARQSGGFLALDPVPGREGNPSPPPAEAAE
ncbi:ABC-type multidrug transport system, ATPase and permease component [Rubellimicrobium thermophilum DSM 16684]|uniref:ABC-type multidrug transport system, ATPase and permease component n=1 Tax=Rubellimicrobium thermophilum DSM 16684 TaxID=1123069 RepID=S9S2M7_9RHOB|nr:ABC-type multidrug transport system, ATPase and permease component [Rubellimicrobium thermophilum DSM 16684]